MGTYKVNENTQVNRDGTVIPAGKTFTATAEEVEAEGLTSYVTKVAGEKAKKAAPAKTAARTTEDTPNKAQTSSANK